MEYKSRDYVENIELYLRKIDYIIRKKGREILQDYKMTIPQFTALQIMINNEDITIGELSQKMNLACSTITDLVSRMENTELVLRKKDEKDKRVVRIEVLDKGHEILHLVMEKRRDYLSEKLTDIDSENKHALNDALEKLFDAMKE